MRSITIPLQRLPGQAPSSKTGALDKRRSGSQPTPINKPRRVSTQPPNAVRGPRKPPVVPAPVRAFAHALTLHSLRDRQTRDARLSDLHERLQALRAAHARADGQLGDKGDAAWTRSVLMDLRWLLNNAAALLFHFEPTSPDACFEEALLPAYRRCLVDTIAQRFAGFDSDAQALLLAVCEPGVLQSLLAEAQGSCRSLPKGAQQGQTIDPMLPRLTQAEVLSLFDYHSGSSKTFMVVNCAARLAATLQDPQLQEHTRFLDAPRASAYKEAAAELDIPIGTVRSRVSRARLAVREYFSAAGADAGY